MGQRISFILCERDVVLFSVHFLFVTTGKSQQVQQAGEQVENGNIQRDSRHDVVGFAAVQNIAGFIQDQA